MLDAISLFYVIRMELKEAFKSNNVMFKSVTDSDYDNDEYGEGDSNDKVEYEESDSESSKNDEAPDSSAVKSKDKTSRPKISVKSMT